MKNIKYLLVVFITIMLLPLSVSAASLSFEGAPNNNKATYDIKYTPDETPFDTLTIKIDKTNDGEGIGC